MRQNRTLILGGTAQSKHLAQLMINAQYNIIYSIAGLVRYPQLNCEIHCGGFSDSHNRTQNRTQNDTQDDTQNGIGGLIRYCTRREVSLVIDATHPYAENISQHAVVACAAVGIPCWRLDRAGWDAAKYKNWHDYDSVEELLNITKSYLRPFYSIGKSALKFSHRRPPQQQWIVRSAQPFPPEQGIIQVNAIGPFCFQQELNLMQKYQVDALISKNSGCVRVIAKVDAAQALGLPLFVQRRPPLPEVERNFWQAEELLAAISTLI